MALILNSRSNATAGNVPASDVSSPDLGVDLGSDPFSSLERTNDISLVQQLGNYILVGPIFVGFRLRQKPGFLLKGRIPRIAITLGSIPKITENTKFFKLKKYILKK